MEGKMEGKMKGKVLPTFLPRTVLFAVGNSLQAHSSTAVRQAERDDVAIASLKGVDWRPRRCPMLWSSYDMLSEEDMASA
jgi:hypothetical protein